jgi:glucose dehydrogenase
MRNASSVVLSTAKDLLLIAVLAAPSIRAQQTSPSGEWLAYGHDALGSRFSPLAQITRENVSTLAVAWTYRTGEVGVKTRQPVKFEATPLMVEGTLYLSTPFGRVMALDPQTGVARWTYDAHANRDGDWGDFANRGVSTWLDAKAPQGAVSTSPRSTRASSHLTREPARSARHSVQAGRSTCGRDCATPRTTLRSTSSRRLLP